MKTDLKTLRTYKIKLMNPATGLPYDKEIRGYRVIIDGYEEYEFFVHRTSSNDFMWRVSEKGTGFCFPYSCDGFTRIEVIRYANIKLVQFGKEKFKDVITKAYKKLSEVKP